ncbi:MAG: hypothetical protein GF334_01160 [Candidatus Altiarchaeales archaeon]|nr:hypothetical protein [Candidatus Altiarchaeales archaeon]
MTNNNLVLNVEEMTRLCVQEAREHMGVKFHVAGGREGPAIVALQTVEGDPLILFYKKGTETYPNLIFNCMDNYNNVVAIVSGHFSLWARKELHANWLWAEPEEPDQRLVLGDRQLATILAALRCYTESYSQYDYRDIATNDGAFEAMAQEEIVALCEWLNTR